MLTSISAPPPGSAALFFVPACFAMTVSCRRSTALLFRRAASTGGGPTPRLRWRDRALQQLTDLSDCADRLRRGGRVHRRAPARRGTGQQKHALLARDELRVVPPAHVVARGKTDDDLLLTRGSLFDALDVHDRLVPDWIVFADPRRRGLRLPPAGRAHGDGFGRHAHRRHRARD